MSIKKGRVNNMETCFYKDLSLEDIGSILQIQTIYGTEYAMFTIDRPDNIKGVRGVVNLDTNEILGCTLNDSLYDYLAYRLRM